MLVDNEREHDSYIFKQYRRYMTWELAQKLREFKPLFGPGEYSQWIEDVFDAMMLYVSPYDDKEFLSKTKVPRVDR